MNSKEKEFIPMDENTSNYPYDDAENIVSATDCTGLIPTPPVNQTEAESYAELHSIPQPSTEKEGLKQNRHSADSIK